MKLAALYLRVSTSEQTTDNQKLELQRIAAAKGWTVVEIYEDLGISGASGREKRQSYDRMLKDAVRSKFNVVMAWDISRLSRSLQELVRVLEELNSNRVDLYLHQQAIDTTTPSGLALFQMCGVFAQFERSMISERVRAGLSRSRASGTKLGRPKIKLNTDEALTHRKEGRSIRSLAKKYGVSVGKMHSSLKDN